MAERAQFAKVDQGLVVGRGVAFPVRIGVDGRVAWSEGLDNVRECIRVILTTQTGERIMLPEFGARLQSALFEPNTAATRRLLQKEIQEALERWEPRIQLESVRLEAIPDDERFAIATITYRLRATQVTEQVNLKIALGV